MSLTDEAEAIALEAAHEAIHELQDDGLSESEALDIVFNVLDQILAFKEVGSLIGSTIGGPAGGAAGAIAGEAGEAASDAMLKKLQESIAAGDLDPDPAKIDARAAKAEERGHPKIAARRRARAARVRARQET